LGFSLPQSIRYEETFEGLLQEMWQMLFGTSEEIDPDPSTHS
jgi:hypothetical protein